MVVDALPVAVTLGVMDEEAAVRVFSVDRKRPELDALAKTLDLFAWKTHSQDEPVSRIDYKLLTFFASASTWMTLSRPAIDPAAFRETTTNIRRTSPNSRR